MLETDVFKTIVANAPLVSIDICLIHNNRILLGKRINEPLKGRWFTPGGRIFKNETLQECLRRVADFELGIAIEDLPRLKLMGAWDHLYENSFIDQKISTHYVNLPHYCILRNGIELTKDQQHSDLSWFDLKEVAENKNFHEYIQNYASLLINLGKKL